MTERIISSRVNLYMGGMVYLTAFIFTSIVFKDIVESFQIVPMILMTPFFVTILLLTLTFFNRRVYLNILVDGRIQYGKLFGEAVVPVNEATNVRKVFGRTYKVTIGGRWYLLYCFDDDARYLKGLIDLDESHT